MLRLMLRRRRQLAASTEPSSGSSVTQPPGASADTASEAPRSRGSEARPPAALPGTLLALLVALIAIAAGLMITSAPVPQRGAPITARAYAVDVDWLRGSRARRASAAEAVHAAADRLAATFAPSAADAGLARFLNESAAATAGRPGQVALYAKTQLFWALQRLLGWSRPEASGFVRLATLYAASEAQLHTLVRDVAGPASGAPRTLLDVGSGTGTETAKLAAALGVDAEHVTCLENARPLQRQLLARGFRAVGSPAELSDTALFSAAALLNVLDRCDEPAALLDAAVRRVAPGGLLLLAAVLPFRASVYEGRVGTPYGRPATRKPRAPLALHPAAEGDAAPAFEPSAAVFLEAILRRHPRLELVRWTRLPYVSSGDLRLTHHTLDMAAMALRLPPAGAHPPPDAPSGPAPASADAEQSRRHDGGRAVPAKCRKHKTDGIYAWLATAVANEGLESWGDVLDAGAGFSSMCWLLRQAYRTVTGVTASADGTYGAAALRQAVAAVPDVEVALGNWRDEPFLRARRFDVVVADYLLGAVEQHWAYGADEMMDRLLRAVRPGGHLLVVGLEPYELVLDRAAGSRDRLVLDVEAVGDTAAALAGESTYRELPERWVRHQIARRPEFRVVAAKHFAVPLTVKTLRRQLSYARDMAAKIEDPELRDAYVQRINALDLDLGGWSGGHQRARNYALVVHREGSPADLLR